MDTDPRTPTEIDSPTWPALPAAETYTEQAPAEGPQHRTDRVASLAAVEAAGGGSSLGGDPLLELVLKIVEEESPIGARRQDGEQPAAQPGWFGMGLPEHGRIRVESGVGVTQTLHCRVLRRPGGFVTSQPHAASALETDRRQLGALRMESVARRASP